MYNIVVIRQELATNFSSICFLLLFVLPVHKNLGFIETSYIYTNEISYRVTSILFSLICSLATSNLTREKKIAQLFNGIPTIAFA